MGERIWKSKISKSGEHPTSEQASFKKSFQNNNKHLKHGDLNALLRHCNLTLPPSEREIHTCADEKRGVDKKGFLVIFAFHLPEMNFTPLRKNIRFYLNLIHLPYLLTIIV